MAAGTGALTYSISPTLPTGLSISSTSGAVTGTPSGTSAATGYTVTVTDTNGATATNNFSLTVKSAVSATQSIASALLTQSHAATSFIPVTGGGGTGTLTYSISPTLPAGFELQLQHGCGHRHAISYSCCDYLHCHRDGSEQRNGIEYLQPDRQCSGNGHAIHSYRGLDAKPRDRQLHAGDGWQWYGDAGLQCVAGSSDRVALRFQYGHDHRHADSWQFGDQLYRYGDRCEWCDRDCELQPDGEQRSDGDPDSGEHNADAESCGDILRSGNRRQWNGDTELRRISHVAERPELLQQHGHDHRHTGGCEHHDELYRDGDGHQQRYSDGHI